MTVSRLIISMAILALAGSLALAGEPVLVLYNERPPYLITGPDGRVRGLTADPAEAALTAANIPHKWVLTPARRQLAMLEQNPGRVCLVGWFRNPEREKIGRFTAPLYKDRPVAALARTHDRRFRQGMSVREALGDPTLLLLMKDSYSYGKELDALIAASAVRIEKTAAENVAMARMIRAGRAGYMFIAPEEAEELLRGEEFRDGGLTLVTFGDAPEGEERHLLCSGQVSAEEIRRIDEALLRRQAPRPRN
ncbi:hypothetical protein NNJEOMEG_03650 [Fundidesulfovibrio magnetotacticus]|uniref:Solute-binding protein family 3/N-terminal domain-containing protein n=1 Tax=Fundidesulfovibrio magnetotacticus TaxID=2730080 RepID=A0A6V8LTI7_9BACT|nr:transporter substrate-binding domain-containing protein [Fundidesulfovibrio magnetotacticus]GFK95782.1 hypothetical protein NNJEOMEG_03650 [Fundidesulfovibrio magnetotacticus]